MWCGYPLSQHAYIPHQDGYNYGYYNLHNYYNWHPAVPASPPVNFYNLWPDTCHPRYHYAKFKPSSPSRPSTATSMHSSSAGEYLTWEMAQDESLLSKSSQVSGGNYADHSLVRYKSLRQASEDASNSTTNATTRRRQQEPFPENGSHQHQRIRHFDVTSSKSLGTMCAPTTALAGAGYNTAHVPAGNMTPSSCSSSSAVSTPHVYQNRSKPPMGIQRRHSAFQAGMKSPPDGSASEQIDRVLERLDDGVELAFGRAKAWSKYCKEILNYVHRRINLESEHARAVQKLTESTQTAIEEEHFLPLQNVYLTSFKMEHEFFDNSMDTMKRLYEYKYIKPLEARKLEQDRKRKELKAQWERCNKQVQDAASELKKSKQNFLTRESNYKKARENSVKLELSSPDKSKIDKRRKMEEDAMLRRQQAAEEVRSLETRLEEKYDELERMKAKVLDDIRELIYQCDQTTKACTSAYFQAMAGLWAPLPAQYQSLSESCRAYIPGMEYAQYIKQLPHNPESTRCHGRAASDDVLPSISINGHMMSPERPAFLEVRHKTSAPSVTLHTAPQSSSSYFDSGDEIGSVNSYGEGMAIPVTCASSPAKTGKPSMIGHTSAVSEAALTHSLQKVRLPTKCCHCDSYTFFQTVQCSECCMTWHKQCLSSLDVPCDVAKRMVSGALQRRMSTRVFGAPLPPDGAIPIVLQNCIAELEKRGCRIKGLYRVCGVKSKIEELCEQFERDTVNFSEVHPTNVASVVKLYLRQLPEPILTLKLYSQFIALAKAFPVDHVSSQQVSTTDSIISQLRSIVQQLPRANFDTVKYLILHLHRLTWFEDENQMSAGNLGIVFGPTLLRRDDDGSSQASLNSLMEAPLQTRAIELLIEHAYEVFGTDATQDLERLGITRRTSAHRKFSESAQRNLALPEEFSSTLSPRDAERRSDTSESPRCGLDEDDPSRPPRTSTTPDLLKGSRTMHDRSMSIPASSSSDCSADSPDDSPERKTSSGAEWRNLLASAASHEQRLHHALTAVLREKSAPIGQRRGTSPADLKSYMGTTCNENKRVKDSSVSEKAEGQRVPVASPESCCATPASTPVASTEYVCVGSPFQRAKGVVVRRVSSHKGALVKRSTSACGQADDGEDNGDHGGEFTGKDMNPYDVEGHPRKPVQAALKRCSAPVLEKKQIVHKTSALYDARAKRKSDTVSYMSTPGAPGDRRGTVGGSALRTGDLAYI